MLKATYNGESVNFISDNLDEALLKSEALTVQHAETFVHSVTVQERGKEQRRSFVKSHLEFHQLVTRYQDKLKNHPVIDALDNWGLSVEEESMKKTDDVIHAKRRKYLRDKRSIEEIKHSPEYQRAMEMVENAYGKPLKDGRRLFDYQKEGAALIIAKKRLLLGYEMGLGKTIVTLVGLTANPANKKVLIVTMSRNIGDWEREIKALGLENDYIILQHPKDLRSDKRIHLVSYEKWAMDSITFRQKLHEDCPNCRLSISFNRKMQYCKNCKDSFVPFSERYSEKNLPKTCPVCAKDWSKGKFFCSCGFSVIETRKKSLSTFFHRGYDASAVDEGHYLKNGNTKRSLSVVRKIKTKTRVILTGTPAENGTDDLYWPLIWLMGDSYFFENPITLKTFPGYGKLGEEHFRNYYGGGKKRAVFDVNSIEARVSNTAGLWELLDSILVRKKKQDEDVKNDVQVPKPNHRRMHLTLEQAERDLYDNLLSQFREWYQMELYKKESAATMGDVYRISTIEICTWMDKLRKAASCPWMFDEFDAAKVEEPVKLRYVKEKVKEYARRGKKLLVFTAHKKTAEDLGIFLNGVLPNQEAAYIHGSVNMRYRFELMERFQDPNDPLQVLVMTTRTGAESYTLTEAKAVVLYDLEFNAKKIEQCYSRAVRLGQRDVVDIYWLIATDTIDANMHGLVLSKQSGVDLAIDREELDFEEIAKQFESDETISTGGIDMESFAANLLERGTKREDVSVS